MFSMNKEKKPHIILQPASGPPEHRGLCQKLLRQSRLSALSKSEHKRNLATNPFQNLRNKARQAVRQRQT